MIFKVSEIEVALLTCLGDAPGHEVSRGLRVHERLTADGYAFQVLRRRH